MVYICNNCFSDEIDINNMTCLHCNSNNIFSVDDLCADTIINLNKFFIDNNKSIRTIYSCEGHFINKQNIMIPYILFKVNNNNDIVLLQNLLNDITEYLIEYGLIENNNKYDLHDNKINFLLKPRYERQIINRFEYNEWKHNLWTIFSIITHRL